MSKKKKIKGKTEKMNERVHILFIVLNVLITISLILALVFKTDFYYSLYWFVVPLITVISILKINKWKINDKELEVDKSIQRSYDDSTVLLIVFYGLVLLIIEFIDIVKEGVRDNPYFIVGFFIITIVYELFIIVSEYKAKKEIEKQLKERK